MPTKPGQGCAERKIVINGRFLTQPMSGVQRYAREVVSALDKLMQHARWSGVDCRLLAPEGAYCELELKRISFETVGGGHGHTWEQGSLAFFARKATLVSLCNSGPILHPRQMVVIHDAAVHRHPEHFGRAYSVAHRHLEQMLARHARIATVSEFSRKELSSVLGIAAEKILVVPNGAEHLRQVLPDQSILERLGIARTAFFLMVGNITRNKNVEIVAKALSHINRDDFRVVVAGRADPKIFGGASATNSDRIVFAGRVSDEELRALYASAIALLFTSRYEGFGIPPLEAFMAGCAVIAARIDAVEEVCADAASYFEPENDEVLADLMLQYLDEKGKIALRKEERIGRAGEYTWAKSADILLESLLKI